VRYSQVNRCYFDSALSLVLTSIADVADSAHKRRSWADSVPTVAASGRSGVRAKAAVQ
jgi:hypothetical protein